MKWNCDNGLLIPALFHHEIPVLFSSEGVVRG
jgi:hypothetical protein